MGIKKHADQVLPKSEAICLLFSQNFQIQTRINLKQKHQLRAQLQKLQKNIDDQGESGPGTGFLKNKLYKLAQK